MKLSGNEFTRREFTKLGSLGLGSLAMGSMAPALLGQSGKRVGYAVIGIGRIAGHFLPATKSSRYSKITGLVSGHRDKAERTAAEYDVPTGSIYDYENFDKIADDKSIDAVYVALPNSMHAEYTIRAAKAGKHVLCEKPMALNVAECERMIAACKANNVKLMIAYRLHFEPITQATLEIVRSGRLGRLQSMTSENGFSIAQHEWRTQKAMAGGGSMFDVGIYCVNAFRYFAGEDPTENLAQISTQDKDDPRFKEIEEQISWLSRFPSGVLTTGLTSYGANLGNMCKIYGTRGSLEYGGYGYAGQSLKGHCAISPEPGAPVVAIEESNSEQDPMQFVRQVDHFSNCILENKTPATPGEEGLADLRVVESVYKAGGQPLA